MEIKKYVLLEDKTIQECDENKMHITNDNYLIMNSGMVIGKVLKSSDNILDLVDDGDLVETKQSIMDVDEVIKEDEEFIFYLSYDVVFDNNIIAIYKKQPNGDYKKYEVEE